MADGSLLHILAGMIVLSQHWYNSPAGDGSLVLMGVAWNASKARCGLALLYLAHWSACLMDLNTCLGKSIGLWVVWSCGALSEQRTLGMPCSENISFSSEVTLLALLWPGGRHHMKIIFE